jgi:hypothetical protein
MKNKEEVLHHQLYFPLYLELTHPTWEMSGEERMDVSLILAPSLHIYRLERVGGAPKASFGWTGAATQGSKPPAEDSTGRQLPQVALPTAACPPHRCLGDEGGRWQGSCSPYVFIFKYNII